MKNLLRTLLATYGAHTPYHPGKWRVVDAVHEGMNLQPVPHDRRFPVSRAGLKWDLRLDCCIQRALYYLGVYERQETRWIRNYLQPGMTVLDIGSNFGYYALLAAGEVGPGGKVMAFEPYEPNRIQPERHIELNGLSSRVSVAEQALSDGPGTLSFVIPPDSCLGVGHLAAEGQEGATVEVPVTTLDAWASGQDLGRLDFIKLDVEGAESLVLRGGQETFSRFLPAMLVEINPEGLAAFGSTPWDLIQSLQNLGYGLNRVKGGQLVPLTVNAGTDFEAMFGDHGNTIALPARPGRTGP